MNLLSVFSADGNFELTLSGLVVKVQEYEYHKFITDKL